MEPLTLLALRQAMMQDQKQFFGPYTALNHLPSGQDFNKFARACCQEPGGLDWIKMIEPWQCITNHIVYEDLAIEAIKYGRADILAHVFEHPAFEIYGFQTRSGEVHTLLEKLTLEQCSKLIPVLIDGGVDGKIPDTTMIDAASMLFPPNAPEESYALLDDVLGTFGELRRLTYDPVIPEEYLCRFLRVKNSRLDEILYAYSAQNCSSLFDAAVRVDNVDLAKKIFQDHSYILATHSLEFLKSIDMARALDIPIALSPYNKTILSSVFIIAALERNTYSAKKLNSLLPQCKSFDAVEAVIQHGANKPISIIRNIVRTKGHETPSGFRLIKEHIPKILPSDQAVLLREMVTQPEVVKLLLDYNPLLIKVLPAAAICSGTVAEVWNIIEQSLSAGEMEKVAIEYLNKPLKGVFALKWFLDRYPHLLKYIHLYDLRKYMTDLSDQTFKILYQNCHLNLHNKLARDLLLMDEPAQKLLITRLRDLRGLQEFARIVLVRQIEDSSNVSRQIIALLLAEVGEGVKKDALLCAINFRKKRLFLTLANLLPRELVHNVVRNHLRFRRGYWLFGYKELGMDPQAPLAARY